MRHSASNLPPPALQNRPRDYITLGLCLLALTAAPLCLLWNACCLALYPATLLGLRPLAWAVTPRSLYAWLHGAFVKACSEWRELTNAEGGWGMVWQRKLPSAPDCPCIARQPALPLYPRLPFPPEWLGTARYCEGEAEQPRYDSGDYLASTGGWRYQLNQRSREPQGRPRPLLRPAACAARHHHGHPCPAAGMPPFVIATAMLLVAPPVGLLGIADLAALAVVYSCMFRCGASVHVAGPPAVLSHDACKRWVRHINHAPAHNLRTGIQKDGLVASMARCLASSSTFVIRGPGRTQCCHSSCLPPPPCRAAPTGLARSTCTAAGSPGCGGRTACARCCRS